VITPKFPWSDPFIINIPSPTACQFDLSVVQPDGSTINYGGLQGTVSAIKTAPKDAYAFSGTSLDLVTAVLAPEPSGVQKMEVTCSFAPPDIPNKPADATPAA
jgi:hypothetical protein